MAEQDKGYAKFNYSMNMNGDILTIRSDTWEDIVVAIPSCKKFLFDTSEEKRLTVKESVKANPTPYPSNITKPEKCPTCGSTELNYVSGTNKKTGKDWFAFECGGCKSTKDGKEYPTRIFVNPNDIKKARPEKLPESQEKTYSGGKKQAEKTKCSVCGREIGYGITKFCQSKKIPPTCMTCQKKE